MLGMPSIEIEFEFDMVFCFGIRLAPYAISSTRIYLQHIAQLVESDRSINIVFVRPSVRSSVISLQIILRKDPGKIYFIKTME